VEQLVVWKPDNVTIGYLAIRMWRSGLKILVAVDLSEYTETIVGEAQNIAGPLSAEVWLLHVAEPDPDFVGYDAGPQSERDAMAEHFHREHSEIQALAEKLRQEGLEATALLVQGATAETILSEASKLQVNMIIVGSHGRGAINQLLVGSVSEGVLRRADSPVLVIPTRKLS
jgi:nucleotide-binding universal stress UspA family protein